MIDRKSSIVVFKVYFQRCCSKCCWWKNTQQRRAKRNTRKGIKIEEILPNNFEVQLSKICEETTHNGFDKNEFTKQFKIENNVSLFDFRQVKELEYALNLLKEGGRIKVVSKKMLQK